MGVLQKCKFLQSNKTLTIGKHIPNGLLIRFAHKALIVY
jgi:hypothetical protein